MSSLRFLQDVDNAAVVCTADGNARSECRERKSRACTKIPDQEHDQPISPRPPTCPSESEIRQKSIYATPLSAEAFDQRVNQTTSGDLDLGTKRLTLVGSK